MPMSIGRTGWRAAECWEPRPCGITGNVSSQWFDSHVEPKNFTTEADGRIAVDVHQVVHDKAGKLLADQMVQHVYEIRDGLIRSMEIRRLD